MSLYAIGDIQGCFEPFQRLLEQIRFDPARDRLWLVGDLVNRGPQSLATLRFVRALGEATVTVLGNHDLHLLMLAEGHSKKHHDDTLDEILAAPDRQELLDWLRHRPMIHVEAGHVLVHAGLLPQWSVAQAQQYANEVEAALRGPHWREFMAQMWGSEPAGWSDALEGWPRLRVIVNALTRLRLCTPDGVMDFRSKGTPVDAPAGYLPWFAVPQRRSRDHVLVTGHWSALGLRLEANLLAIDTGCLWGRQLTAIRLPDRRLFSVACAGACG